MELPDQLRCLFSAQLEERDGSYVIDVPKQEVEVGDIKPGGTYRVALLSAPTAEKTPSTDESKKPSNDSSDRQRAAQKPPVKEGETRRVEIEELGDQGDGIAKVERGYVVVVPDTEKGERVEIEITDVRQNVAFAEVTERISYYD